MSNIFNQQEAANSTSKCLIPPSKTKVRVLESANEWEYSSVEATWWGTRLKQKEWINCTSSNRLRRVTSLNSGSNLLSHSETRRGSKSKNQEGKWVCREPSKELFSKLVLLRMETPLKCRLRLTQPIQIQICSHLLKEVSLLQKQILLESWNYWITQDYLSNRKKTIFWLWEYSHVMRQDWEHASCRMKRLSMWLSIR